MPTKKDSKRKRVESILTQAKERERERVRAEWLVGVMLCWVLLYICGMPSRVCFWLFFVAAENAVMI